MTLEYLDGIALRMVFTQIDNQRQSPMRPL
jgi:hypothetical protein